MRKVLALTAVSLAGIASPALAQTYVEVRHEQAAPYIPYAPVPPQPQYDPYIPYQPVPLDGVSYGGEAGFDVALGSSVVIGGYGGAEESSIKDCDIFAGQRVCTKAGRTYTAGGRIGFLLSPQALIYAKGGYSNGRIEATIGNPVAPGATIREHEDLDGFHVGAGVEAALGRHAYGKIEYVFTRLRDLDLSDGTSVERIDVDRHQVKAGVGLRL